MTLDSLVQSLGNGFPALARWVSELRDDDNLVQRQILASRVSGYLVCLMDMDLLEPDDYLPLTDEIRALEWRDHFKTVEPSESAQCSESSEKSEPASDVDQISVPATRSGLRLQRLLRGSLAGKTATIAVAITAMPGLRAGWAARLRKWPLVLHTGNSVCEACPAFSSAKILE